MSTRSRLVPMAIIRLKRVIENSEITVSGAADEASNNQWEYYINEIHEVDKFIGKLKDALAA